jgi:hypothetical protein
MMNMIRSLSVFSLALLFVACGDEDRDPTPARSVRFVVTHTASSAFAPATGPVAVFGDLLLGATDSGIQAFDLTGDRAGKPRAGYQEWALTSTGSGPAISAIVTNPPLDRAFFLPAGRPQVGEIEIGSGTQGRLIGEGVLAAPLMSSFPAGLLLAGGTLWVSDAPFGAGSVLRAFDIEPRLAPDSPRDFELPTVDLDGDRQDDVLVSDRIAATPDPTIGLLSFTVLGNTARGIAGGVLAVDLETGGELGRIVERIALTSSTAIGFVAAIGATDRWIVVAAADKAPDFSDLSGQIALYRVTSWRPFAVEEPVRLTSSVANPRGIAIAADHALVVSAPYLGQGKVDVIDLRLDSPQIVTTLPIGAPYGAGLFLPQDPVVTKSGDAAFVGTEKGVLRIEILATVATE